jgi:predicted metal-dependent phosphoesterase TrpH
MKADLHVHSVYSRDAISKPQSILAAAADRGIGIIAITDHDTAEGWNPLIQVAKRYPVQVVLGQEIKVFKGGEAVGELLGLFLQTPVISSTVAGVVEEIRRQTGLVSIAHPFCERRGEFRAFDDFSDWNDIAIEALNGRCYKYRDNEMAQALAGTLNAPVTAGSDAHTPFEIGNAFLEFEGKTVDDLKDAILHQEVQTGGRSSSALFSLISGFGRFGIAV